MGIYAVTVEPAQQTPTARLIGLGFVGLGLLISITYGLLVWYSADQLDRKEINQSLERVEVALERELDALAALLALDPSPTQLVRFYRKSRTLRFPEVERDPQSLVSRAGESG